MRKIAIGVLAIGVSLSSAFAAYVPTMNEEKAVDAAWAALIQIIETNHGWDFGLLLGILKTFESKVATDERKSWILDKLIELTMQKMWVMMDDDMMGDSHMWDDMMGDSHMWDDMMDDDMMDDDMMMNKVAFDISWWNYAYSEETLTVNEGDEVTINFSSDAGFHDRVIDEFGATAKVTPEDWETSITFIADQKWTFEYYCSVGNHRAQWMVGNLIVQ